MRHFTNDRKREVTDFGFFTSVLHEVTTMPYLE